MKLTLLTTVILGFASTCARAMVMLAGFKLSRLRQVAEAAAISGVLLMAMLILSAFAQVNVLHFKNYVNDYVGVIPDNVERQLKGLLKQLEKKTGAQIAVVVIDSTRGIPAADYAVQFGNEWGVGQKEKDNGIVFLVAVQDREMFIATGKGLLSVLPDKKVARIRDQDILPYFRKGDFAGGIRNGTLRLVKEIAEAEGLSLQGLASSRGTTASVEGEATATPQKGKAKASRATRYGERVWSVQINAFTYQKDARNLTKKLKDKGYDAYVVSYKKNGRIWYLVRVGHLATQGQAKRMRDTLQKKEKYTKALIMRSMVIAQKAAGPPAESLVAALEAYEKVVVDKLNSDLGIIARAFSDARDIQKARRWADWAKVPLDTISLVLSIPQNPTSIVRALGKAQNQLELLSFLFKLHTLSVSAQGLKLAIRGPEYSEAVTKMLAEADRAIDKGAYQDTILAYLHGLSGRKSPASIVIETERGKETLSGVKEFKARLRALLDETKGEVAALPGLPEPQLKKLVGEVEVVKLNVKRSKSQNVELSGGVTLGRINPLELVRMDALSRYDQDMKIEQVNTIVSTAESICVLTSYSLTGGVAIGSAHKCAPISGGATLLKAINLSYRTSARKQVNELPFEMLLSLPGEAASLWKSTQRLAGRIRSMSVARGKVDPDIRDEKGRTPLMKAAEKGDTATVRALLNRGADVNAKTTEGWTALLAAAERGHTKIVQALLNKGADVNAKDKNGWTVLMTAAKHGHTVTMEALLDKGGDVGAKNNIGSTPLMVAAYYGHTAAVQTLLDKGANVNAKNNHGRTALVMAVRSKNTSTVQALLDKDADVNAKSKFYETALFIGAAVGQTAITRLLLGKGADVNAKDKNGWTVLMVAAKRGHTETVQVLLNKGADVNTKIKGGWTALMYAAKSGHAEIVQALVNKGADVNTKIKDGWTALTLAAQEGHSETVQALLHGGADVNAKIKDGWTALALASKKGHREIVELLTPATTLGAASKEELKIPKEVLRGEREAQRRAEQASAKRKKSQEEIASVKPDMRKYSTKLHKFWLLSSEIDAETGVRFSFLFERRFSSLHSAPPEPAVSCKGYWIPVVGEVPPNIDLANESVEEKLMQKAKLYAFKLCPNLAQENQDIWVSLYSGQFNPKKPGQIAPLFDRFDPYHTETGYERPAKDHKYRNEYRRQALRKKREEERQRRAEERAREKARRRTARRKAEQEVRERGEAQRRTEQARIAKRRAEVEKLKSEQRARWEAQKRAEQPRILAAKRARKLTRANAAILLSGTLKEQLLQRCSLENVATVMSIGKFVAEPELGHLWNETFCDFKVVVTGIRKISETEAEVGSKIMLSSRGGSFKKLRKAIEEFRKSLSNTVAGVELVSQKVNVWGKPLRPGFRGGLIYRSMRWMVTFPDGHTEGVECSHEGTASTRYLPNVVAWHRAGFSSSDACKNAPKHEVFFHTPTALLLDKGLRSIRKTSQEKPPEVEKKNVFQLWDDGWRVIR